MARKNKKVGTIAGIPYDWRAPTVRRLKDRVWNPGTPFLNRRWYGWGYDFNFYAVIHPLKWRQARSRINKKKR